MISGKDKNEWEKNCCSQTNITVENICVVRDLLEGDQWVRLSKIAEQVGISYGSC